MSYYKEKMKLRINIDDWIKDLLKNRKKGNVLSKYIKWTGQFAVSEKVIYERLELHERLERITVDKSDDINWVITPKTYQEE
jgi:hypothetical protein